MARRRAEKMVLEVDYDATCRVDVQRHPRGERMLNVMFRRPDADFAKGLTVTLSDEDAERLRGELERSMRT